MASLGEWIEVFCMTWPTCPSLKWKLSECREVGNSPGCCCIPSPGQQFYQPGNEGGYRPPCCRIPCPHQQLYQPGNEGVTDHLVATSHPLINSSTSQTVLWGTAQLVATPHPLVKSSTTVPARLFVGNSPTCCRIPSPVQQLYQPDSFVGDRPTCCCSSFPFQQLPVFLKVIGSWD